MKYLLEGQETERILFRKIQLTDFADWVTFFGDPRAWEHWICERKEPKEECQEWYEKQLNRYLHELGGMNALVEKSSNKLIGHCGLLIQQVDGVAELEIAYSILPTFWGKGLASEAARKCRDFAFANQLASSLISIISLTNHASQKVAIKNGMQIDKTTVYKNNQVHIFRIRHWF